jgi:hypothetical protein
VPVTIEKIPDSPIVMSRATQGEGDVVQQALQTNAEIKAVLDEQTEKVFLIIDLRDISVEFGDLVQVAMVSARGPDSLLHHPKIRENLFVMGNGVLRMGAKGLDNVMFGLLRTRTFDTPEEALNYCREQLKSGM